MDKVYVLNAGNYDAYIVGIFTSKEKAEKERERIMNKDKYYRNNPLDLWIV